MYLYYDRVAEMYTLDTGEDVVFLGGTTNAVVNLQRNYDLTNSQAREAILQAFMNMGDSVDIRTIRKIASGSKFYRKNIA
jgi:hypothetical protein